MLSSFDAPSSNPYGLEWGGGYLWVSDWDENKIYKMAVVGVERYSLSTTASPSGGGSVTRSPSADNYENGTVVTLTAVPENGYVFDHWSGDASGTSASVTVIMDTDKNVTANFIQSGGSGGGGLPVTWIGAGAVILVVVIGGVFVLRRRGGGADASLTPSPEG